MSLIRFLGRSMVFAQYLCKRLMYVVQEEQWSVQEALSWQIQQRFVFLKIGIDVYLYYL